MISKQILQSTLDGFCEITGGKLCICSADGDVLAAAQGTKPVNAHVVQGFDVSGLSAQPIGGRSFFRVSDEFETEYIVIADGDDADSAMQARLLAYQLRGLLTAYKDKVDRDNFIKNLLLDNLLLVDIYNRAKKLHINTEAVRVVYTLACGGSESAAFEVLRAQLSARSTDFVTAVDEDHIVLIHELRGQDADNTEEVLRFAREIRSIVSGCGTHARIAFGNPVSEIREVSRSYKEAKLALDVGEIFYEAADIIGYNRLGIGRLIYQLPPNLCRMYLSETLGGCSPDELDEETLVTIRQFFENSLNVSETARKLFIHRNTLVYRLDKIAKMTGLDLRVFDDAIVFKIAMMVAEYMKHIEAGMY